MTATSPVPSNRLRRVLAERVAVGTMIVEWRSPAVMQVLANAGLDVAIIDNEHGPFGIETIAELCRAGVQSGVTPIVRPPELTYAHITQPLDAGAQGIMLPRVRGAAEVRTCLEWMKYPPDGRRGAVLARGHTLFRGGELTAALAAGNRESYLIVQIETREAVEDLDAILDVAGVDAALIGPTDLSLALGVAGQMQHPRLVEAIERTIAACRRHGVTPAIHHNDPAEAAAWTGRGMRLVSVGSEVGHLMGGVRGAVERVRAAEAASGG